MKAPSRRKMPRDEGFSGVGHSSRRAFSAGSVGYLLRCTETGWVMPRNIALCCFPGRRPAVAIRNTARHVRATVANCNATPSFALPHTRATICAAYIYIVYVLYTYVYGGMVYRWHGVPSSATATPAATVFVCIYKCAYLYTGEKEWGKMDRWGETRFFYDFLMPHFAPSFESSEVPENRRDF